MVQGSHHSDLALGKLLLLRPSHEHLIAKNGLDSTVTSVSRLGCSIYSQKVTFFSAKSFPVAISRASYTKEYPPSPIYSTSVW